MQLKLFILKVRQLSQFVVLLNLALVSLLISPMLSAESGRSDYDLDDDGLIEINDLEDLNEIRNHLDGTALYGSSAGCPIAGCTGFELTTNLDFDTDGDGVMDANDTYWNSGAGWEPMGSQVEPFSATLEGNDYSILNLYINRTSNSNVALFAYVDNATFQNIHIGGELTSIAGDSFTAGFAGESSTVGSKFQNCSFNGVISGVSTLGGLIAYTEGGSIENCRVEATITGTGSRVGGLVATSVADLNIEFSQFIGNVSGLHTIGGLIGSSDSISISNSYVIADVTATTDSAGGLVGDITTRSSANTPDSLINNSFVLGEVKGTLLIGGLIGLQSTNQALEIRDVNVGSSVIGTDWVGGLIGYNDLSVTLNRVLAYGQVFGNAEVGGLVGYSDSVITATETYWDTDTSGQTTTYGNYGTGLTTSELQCPQKPGDDGCSVALYTTWSTDDWDFGGTSQYPGLIINNIVYHDTDNDNDGIPDVIDVDLDDDGLIEIDSLDDLREIENNLDGTGLYRSSAGCPNSGCNGFELTTDLDFDTNGDGVVDANDDHWESTSIADGWQPIGGEGNPFTAIFEGNDFKILNLVIESSNATSSIGLFRTVDGAVFRNFSIDGELTSVQGGANTGLLFGQADNAGPSLYTCYFSGKVVSTISNVGGIGGYTASADVTNCKVNVSVSTTGSYAGGFFSQLISYSTISDSFFNGTVNGQRRVGGLTGESNDIEIRDSYVIAKIEGSSDFVGGLVGQLFAANSTIIENSFVMGSVSGSEFIGGFVGFGSSSQSFDIRNSYSAASVDGSDLIGGIIGLASLDVTLESVLAFGSVTDNGVKANPEIGGLVGDGFSVTAIEAYWDVDTTGQTSTSGNNGTGLTTSELQCPTSPGDVTCLTPVYSNWSSSNWDFGTDVQYPVLTINGFVYRDSDDDGVWDSEDAFPNDPTETVDTDGDGIGNNADTDDDNDGVLDGDDAFPEDASESADGDADGVGDNSDVDLDNDGLIEIDSLDDLKEINNHLDGTGLYGSSAGCLSSGCNGFELTTDLDFDTNGDGVVDANDDYWESTSIADGWQPIGDFNNPFTAIFEGNGFKILNLVIESSSGLIGLFKVIDGAEFRNISIEGEHTRVQGVSNIGLLFGQAYNDNFTLTNCYFSGEVISTVHVAGGIGGYARGVTVSNCVVNVSVFSPGSLVGGYFGSIDADSTIKNSSFSGTVDGSQIVGGFVGFSKSLQISDSYVIAEITGTGNYVGGLAGQSNGTGSIDNIIENSFVMGSVSGLENVGGLFGLGYASAPNVFEIRNSYSAAKVHGKDIVGGIIGVAYSDMTLESVLAYGSVTDTGEVADVNIGGLIGGGSGTFTTIEAYWDTESTGQLSTFNDSGTGFTTSELQCPTSAGDATCSALVYSNWSTTLWDFGTSDQYPALILNNLAYRDNDIDGIEDNSDLDDDNDGVNDDDDDFPNDDSETIDTDGDGIGNNADTDDDNDGVLDDDDAFPLDDSEWQDSDGDGIGDNSDSTPYPYSGDLNFEFTDYVVAENGFSVDVKVTRTNGDYEELTVDYTMQDGSDPDSSATATNDYIFVADTLTFVDGETEQTITVNVVDDSTYEGDESFTVTLNNLQSIGDSSLGSVATTTITIQEDDPVPPAGEIGFEFAADQVNENDGDISLKVVRDGGSYGEVSVSLVTQDDSATATNDYVASSQTLTFADGEIEKVITISLVNDNVYESDESFSVVLSNVTGGATLGTSTATVTILDDEPVPPAGVLSIENDSYQVNENDSSFDISVIRTGGDFGTISVDIVSQNDSATAGDDYQSINQTLTFADGEIAKTVSVNLIDDSTYEGDESFNLELTNVVGTSINNPNNSTVTILEDDAVPPAGVIQFSGATYSVDEGDGSLTVTVVRSNGSFGDASIGISVEGGSATNLLDYRLSDEQLTFVDGETSLSFTILILDDSEYEGEENLTLRLTHLNGDASLGSIEQTTITIAENDPVPASGDIQFSGSSFSISESFSELTITVLRANGSFGDISLDYEFTNGTAINGEDFNATNGTLFFADGETSQTITIGIVDDTQDETNESFEIALTNPTNTIITGENSATITITDNDVSAEDEEEQTASSGGGAMYQILFVLLILVGARKLAMQKFVMRKVTSTSKKTEF
ncbi:Calx-beta domain-containing protein [Aliikangiella coralliicola]|nr:Calx-beta domain-containing protein [Aliikangiella coralliicola]